MGRVDRALIMSAYGVSLIAVQLATKTMTHRSLRADKGIRKHLQAIIAKDGLWLPSIAYLNFFHRKGQPEPGAVLIAGPK